MLQSSMIHSLSNFFKQNNITFKIIINDVEKLIYEREGQPRKTFNSILESFMKRSKDANLIRNKAKYKFGDYHSYDTIISWLNEIEHFYPNIAKVFTIGQTFEGRNIKGIKIGNPIDKINKRIIWIDAGIHAREWASIHTALYFIDQVKTGSSSHICSEIYHGNAPFSEPETRAIRDKLLSAEMFGKIDAFITLHTYSQMWIYPYGHQRRSFPNDVKDLEKVGKQAVKAVENVYGTKFRLGTGADILYPSSGGSDDWAKSKAGVKFVYLLELRPGENDFDGFLLDRRQLIPTGRETWAGVRVVIDAVMRSKRICTDISPWCMNWIRINPNVCLTALTYMQQQCIRSCRFC
ncbi:unnamed protein product [Brugia pahangi]|uniref:Peptidase_M14 domain-containing protein n=1 Tax=Brugia pahangi TaxID=6280 RepID=A0A158PRJ6_BRUPA|nr:unnamed protein product [Brugia pahangi]